jgi:hypothetical protein
VRCSLSVLHLAVNALVLLNSSCHDDPTAPLPPQTPSTATFVRLVSLRGSIVYGEPWSPDGARLAYMDTASDSIAVFDALTPQSPPRQVASGVFVSQVRWSPDGGWLLLIGSDGSPTFVRHLIAVRVPRPGVPGLVVEVAPPNQEITHAVWGSDGNIYWWDIQTGKRTTLPPPTEWRSDNPSPFAERTHLLPRHDSRTRLLAQFVFETVPAVVETPINLPDSAGSVGHVLGLDVVPGGEQVLLEVVREPCTFTALVDRSGAILTRLWSPCPTGPPGGPFTFEGGGSVAADGRFVIGYRDVEDGHDILSSQLILTDLQASWVVEVAGTSMGLWDAGFAATGLFVAYGNLGGGVEVGVLDVGY